MNLELLDILACPNCKGKLVYDSNKAELICRFDQLVFAVQLGVPIMRVDQAKILTN